MRTTSVKFSAGLLALAVVALIVFLVTFLSKRKDQAATNGQLPRPQRNNNPFALIQLAPDKWAGLIGVDIGSPQGFLKFDNAVNGTRAGFINLYNSYYSRGLRSIKAITEKYVGSNDADELRTWANGVSKFSRYAVDQQLTWPQFYDLGRGIEQHENGKRWVSDQDFIKGYTLATTYTGAR